MGPDFDDLIRGATTWVLPVLFAITLHEAGHAIVAWWLGDDTAYREGRVSLNPLKHIDLFGTIILPALLLFSRAPFMFGWAKPVPVRYGNLRHPRRDAILVIAAGPGANLILATISALLFQALPLVPDAAVNWAAQTLYNSILLNLVLAVFNLLPLPPLDGGNMLLVALPKSLSQPLARLQPYGLMIMLALVVLPSLLGPRFNILGPLIGYPVSWLMPGFEYLAGLNTA